MKEIPVLYRNDLYRMAKVDDEDYTKCVASLWRASGNTDKWIGYAKSPDEGLMHLFILGLRPRKHLVVDHINGDTFDNRKENLRVITPLQNSWNRKTNKNKTSSKFKGVFRYDNPKDKSVLWWAGIRVDKKLIKDHGYLTQEDAAYAYDNLARKHFGEFARPNFPGVVKVPEKRKTAVGYKWIVTRKRCKIQEYVVQITAKHTKDGKRYVKYFNNLPDALVHRDMKLIEFGMTKLEDSDGLLC
jgi:hypothetical protein